MIDTVAPDPCPSDDVPSPCVGVCTIDPSTGWCQGCFRTLDEIAAWSRMSRNEKQAVLARLPSRRPRGQDPG